MREEAGDEGRRWRGRGKKMEGGGEGGGRGRGKEMEGEMRVRKGKEIGMEKGRMDKHTKHPPSLFTYLATRHLGLLRGDLAGSRPWAGPACQNTPSLSCPGTSTREREPIHK